MITQIHKYTQIALAAILIWMLSVAKAFAQGGGTGGSSGGGTNGSGESVIIINPLRAKSITELLIQIIEILLTLAVPVVVFFIMLAGFQFVTARGNQSQIDKAKSTLTWTVIGGTIALTAKLIIVIITNTVKAL